MEFNPDGSLRLPRHMQQHKDENEERMKRYRCMQVRKEMVSFTAPKKCVLHLKLSDAIADSRFVETTYNYFREKAAVPSRLIRINDKEFDIEIGTDFRRCSDCTNLINSYREFLDGNIIEHKGGCSYSPRVFSDEDYFD